MGGPSLLAGVSGLPGERQSSGILEDQNKGCTSPRPTKHQGTSVPALA